MIREELVHRRRLLAGRHVVPERRLQHGLQRLGPSALRAQRRGRLAHDPKVRLASGFLLRRQAVGNAIEACRRALEARRRLEHVQLLQVGREGIGLVGGGVVVYFSRGG